MDVLANHLMSVIRNQVDEGAFNKAASLPYELRLDDFKLALQDVYDFFFDVNSHLVGKGLDRLDDLLRPAIMSGVLSDMLTASVAKHSRTLVENKYFNGHPDLLVKGKYPNNRAKAGEHGVEIKTTRKPGGAVDTHGARAQCVSTAPPGFRVVFISTPCSPALALLFGYFPLTTRSGWPLKYLFSTK